MIQRRSIIIGLGGLVAAPAVVRATSIMSVKGIGRLIFPEDQDVKDVVLFTIYGWDRSELVSGKNAIGDLIVKRADPLQASNEAARNVPIAIHLTQSWQASWP
jgi:hypothetical protein